MPASHAFSVGGIRIRIDNSWFIAFLLFAWTLSAGYYPLQVPDYSSFTYWFFGTLSSLGLFGCVLLHELSHCLVARRLGVPVRQITLFIFGGVSEMAQVQASSPKAEFQTTIAGPLASMGLGFLFLMAAVFVKGSVDRIVVEMLRYLCYVNFLLAAFNLIPGFPLDGGRVLRSYLWYRTGNLRQATRSAARVGQILAVSLMVLGLAATLLMHVLTGIWLILIGLFLKRSAQTEYQSFEVRLGLRDLTVRQIMTPPVAVDISMTVSEFVNEYIFRYHHRAFPALDKDRFVGMVDVRSIRRVPSSEWPSTKIATCLSELRTYCVLDPDVDAAEAFRVLTARNCSRAPVVRDGSLLGILTRSDLLKLIALRQEIAA